MRLKNIKSLILLLLFFSCGGLSDLMLDMGSNYHYYGEGSPFNYIYYEDESDKASIINQVVIKPNVERFSFDENYIVVKQKPDLKCCATLLGSELESIARTFKYVDSLGLENIPKHLQENYSANIKDSFFFRKIGAKITPKNTIEEQKYFWNLSDSIIKQSENYRKIFENEFNYWIIEKETNKVFGPFTEQLFLNKKNELGIPQSLHL